MKLTEAINELRRQYADKARALRLEGNKQSYISSVLGVSQRTLSKWLRGIPRP